MFTVERCKFLVRFGCSIYYIEQANEWNEHRKILLKPVVKLTHRAIEVARE